MTKNPMTEDTKLELDLDGLFAELRAEPAGVPDRLMQAVARDAAAMQPAPAGLAPRPAGGGRSWRDVNAWFSGWPLATGLAACLALGVTVGYTGLDQLTPFTQALTESLSVSGPATDATFSVDDFLSEG